MVSVILLEQLSGQSFPHLPPKHSADLLLQGWKTLFISLSLSFSKPYNVDLGTFLYRLQK